MTIGLSILWAVDRLARPHRRHLRAESSRYNADVITWTRLWRNGPQLRSLACEVLPALAAEYDRPIRVAVHAGSIGCEAVSLLMAARHFGLKHPLEIVSLDIDPAAVRKARRGEYSAEHLTDPVEPTRRLMPDEVYRQYVKQSADGRVTVDPSFIEPIDFQCCDMTDAAQIEAMGTFDLVLCQNVLVHLTREAAIVAVRNLRTSLAPRGLLTLGGTPPQVLSDLSDSLGLSPISLHDRDVYDAWSGRQAIHAKAPRCHLGLEPLMLRIPARGRATATCSPRPNRRRGGRRNWRRLTPAQRDPHSLTAPPFPPITLIASVTFIPIGAAP